MTDFALIQNGVVTNVVVAAAATDLVASETWVDIDAISSKPQIGWTYTNGVFASNQPAPPAPTLAQQAAAALNAGLNITSNGTPAINGTYACDNAAQAKLNRVYGLIQRAGGNALPGGLSTLPWLLADGKTAVEFTSVAPFLAVEQAIGDYVLALDLIIATGAGMLPAAMVNIA